MNKRIKIALCLAAAALLLLGGVACNHSPYDVKNTETAAETADAGEYDLCDLYVSASLGSVEHYGVVLGKTDKVSDPEKAVKIGGVSYNLSLVESEHICSTTGKVLATSNKYYKAAAKDGSTPKLTATYDRDEDYMTTLTVDGFDVSSIGSEEDLTALFTGIMTVDCGDTSNVTPQILSYVASGTAQGFEEGASAYIVTCSDSFAGFRTMSGYMLVRDGALHFSYFRADTERYGEFLNSIDAGMLQRKAGAYINARLDKGASRGAVTFTEGTLVFRTEGGRGCFLFDGTFKSVDGEQSFSAMYFVDHPEEVEEPETAAETEQTAEQTAEQN